MEKIQSSLYFVFLIVFTPAILTVTGLIFTDAFSARMIMYFSIILLLCIILYKLIYNKSDIINNNKKYYFTFLFIISFLFFAFQVINCLKNGSIPKKGDYEAIYTGIKNVVSYGELRDSNLYFIYHPHQTFAMFFYSVINRIFVILGSPDAVNYNMSVIFNCAMISLGSILLSMAVSKHSDNCTGLFTMILFVLCNSYRGCGIYLYTHSLSVFFLCFTLFCFSYLDKITTPAKKILLLFLNGFAFALSKSSEGITLIALIAAIIYLFISCKSIKKFLIDTAGIVLSFTITLSLITATYNHFQIIDYSGDYTAIPLTHWIMMGLSEDGIFVQEDYEATVNLSTKEERVEMHKKEIIKRIKNRTPAEMISHLLKKETLAWVGSTYGTGIPFIDNGYYNHAYRLILILPILINILKTFKYGMQRKKFKVGSNAFCQIYTMGIFLFFCIWEVSSTYLFSSFPVLICCCALSIYNFNFDY